MSHFKKTTFQYSVLAAAMLSLSACSTTPTIAGVDLGRVGSGISKAGSKTMEVGANAWEGTKQLLNIGPQEPELLDEVDLALMEEDADLEAQQGVELAAVDTRPLLPQGDARPSLTNIDNSEKTLAFGEVPQDATQTLDQTGAEGEIVVLASANDTAPVVMSNDVVVAGAELAPSETDNALKIDGVKTEPQTVASQDLTHEVQPAETLWDIAKKTTGDANNWHVIADINNLAPDASVRVGQRITIPADMVKPDYSDQMNPELAAAKLDSDTMQPVEPAEEVAAVALDIPEKSTDVAVATTEQIKPATPAANPANIMADATALKVGEGETLWDFAKRTTGDATNWKTISEKNQFSEQQLASIRPGQKIYVPDVMVRSRDANGVLIPIGEESTVASASVGGVAPDKKKALDASAAVLAGTNTPNVNAPKEGEIKIVEAAYQAEEGVKPLTAETLAKEAEIQVAKNDGELGKVMVRGTYYPKAVYNDADFSSSLLMRVSPGTQLIVSKAIGPWLEVQTDKGVGYVHSRDIK